MKKILSVLAVLFMSLLAFQVMAQSYVPITITSGFTSDIIANGSGSASGSTTTSFDGSGGVYYSADFRSAHSFPCGGLPDGGQVTSTEGNINYQLANYSGSNALMLYNIDDNGTLTFAPASVGKYDKLSLLAASAGYTSGTADFRARINFEGGTYTDINFTVYDWFVYTPGITGINTLGRTYRYAFYTCVENQWDGCQAGGCSASAPCCSYARMFDCVIDLVGPDEQKNVVSVTCQKMSSSAQRCGIFAICGITAPTPVVTALTATSINYFQFNANWVATSGSPTSYRLDVSTNPSFSSFVPGYSDLNVGSATTYPVTGLNPNTPYYYRVRGVNGYGTGSNSNTMPVTTLDARPLAPIADPATNILGTTFDANWHPDPTDPYPPSSYRLDVATTSTFNAGTFVTGYNDLNVGSAVTWPVTGLNVSSTYYYRVRGVNVYGTGPSSNVITVNTTDGLPPAPVATPATAVIQINFWAHWNAGTPTPSEPVDCYYLDVATTSTFDPGTFVGIYNNLNVGLNTMCLVKGLTPGTTYYYRVRAHNQWGLSIDSNVITVITVPSNIPTLSEWGLIILGLVLLGAGTLYITRWHS
ncbi:MAG: fibronectin type III domain-containing protein [Alphaproteobacteria bacterium]|nr:fibronectin type III domain-containing protein [Alphaproteobacteria bacterium]